MSRLVRRTTVAGRYAGRPPAAGRGRTSSPAVIGREMREALSGVLKDVMLTAADAVEANCPIDTGHLLSNFILATGRPHTGVEGSREAVSYAAQDAGRAKILAYDVGRDGKIYLTNHVDYFKFQSGFLTESIMSGVAAAPRGMRGRASKALKSLARSAHRGGK